MHIIYDQPALFFLLAREARIEDSSILQNKPYKLLLIPIKVK